MSEADVHIAYLRTGHPVGRPLRQWTASAALMSAGQCALQIQAAALIACSPISPLASTTLAVLTTPQVSTRIDIPSSQSPWTVTKLRAGDPTGLPLRQWAQRADTEPADWQVMRLQADVMASTVISLDGLGEMHMASRPWFPEQPPHIGIEQQFDFTAADYQQLLLALLPRGLAWDGETDRELMGALAEEFARIQARANQLIDETDPRTMRWLLDDWLALLQIDTTGMSEEEKRQALLARWLDTGGASEAFFNDLLARLGYNDAITIWKPFRAGISRAGDTVGTMFFATWSVQLPEPVPWLETWLRDINPAGNDVMFFYNEDAV